MAMWYSLEVFDGPRSALSWAEEWTDALIGAALGCGATDWEWHSHPWGVVLEVEVEDETAWERFRANSTVVAALDAVPDPLTGLIVYRGRGGSSGTPTPRRPRPLAGSGSAALPLPWDPVADWPTDLRGLEGPAWRRPLLAGVGN